MGKQMYGPRSIQYQYQRTKRLDGKVFFTDNTVGVDWFSTKREAQAEATKRRARGLLARVVKRGGVWHVFEATKH